MLFFAFIGLIIGLQHCSVVVDNIDNVKNMKEICSFECDNISLTNIKSASSTGAFWEITRINDQDEHEPMIASFTDCDFSQSKNFIELYGNFADTTITITNTSIGGGFVGNVVVNEITLVNCVINLTAISRAGGQLCLSHIVFKNCKFVGEITPYNYALFYFWSIPDKYDCVVKFIDCEFDLDEDWNVRYYDNDGVIADKQFIVVNNPSEFTINISFVRCYPGERQKGKSLKLIKVVNPTANEANINIVGEDVGMPIEWSVVDSDDKIYEESEWTVKIDSTGYTPQPPEESTESLEIEDNGPGGNLDGGGKKPSNSEATWRIVAIVFIALFAVAIIVLVVLLLIKKRKYDRSEKE